VLCTSESSFFSGTISEEIAEEGAGVVDGMSEMLLIMGVVLGRVVVEDEI
jgi:hypothetical protein